LNVLLLQVPAADEALLHSAGLKQLRSQWIRNAVSFEEELSGHIQREQTMRGYNQNLANLNCYH
jgi:hypothetical protein